MAKKAIPEKVRQEVNRIVKRLNKDEFGRLDVAFSTRFRGCFLYLDIDDGLKPAPICRLEYTGDILSWEFAIYKYSSGKYDTEEFFFPGSEFIDGTIEGAMRGGLKAYE